MFRRWLDRSRKLILPLLNVAALVLIGLIYFLGIRSERTGFVRDVIDPGFRKLSDPVLNAFRGKPPPVARLSLELDSAAWDSLNGLVGSAMQRGSVSREGNTAFAGLLRTGETELPVVVALREGDLDPGDDRFWPLHVRALPGDTILKMQTFDVIPITDEAPLWSILLSALLKDQGNATLEQAVAEVGLNGKDMGLCMLQGRPDPTMLTAWSRGSGPVLRFDDAMLWDSRVAMAQRRFPSTPPPQGDWFSAPLLLQATDGNVLNRRAQQAIAKMEAFRSGALPASSVFDTPHMARLLALCDLLGTQHAVDWWDLRFLVDSITEKFVPIPLHTSERSAIRSIMATQVLAPGSPIAQGRELVDRVLTDPFMEAAYLAYLDTFSTPGWWELALARTAANWEPARIVVHAEYPRIDLDRSVIEHGRTVIRQTLEPTELVLAYMRDASDPSDGIAVANVHALSVEVHGVILNNGDTVDLVPALRLLPRPKDRPLNYTILAMPRIPKGTMPVELLVRLGEPLKSRAIRIRKWSSFGAN